MMKDVSFLLFKKIHLIIYFFFLLAKSQACGILVPLQGLNPWPLLWNWVLTTGLPRKFQRFSKWGRNLKPKYNTLHVENETFTTKCLQMWCCLASHKSDLPGFYQVFGISSFISVNLKSALFYFICLEFIVWKPLTVLREVSVNKMFIRFKHLCKWKF